MNQYKNSKPFLDETETIKANLAEDTTANSFLTTAF